MKTRLLKIGTFLLTCVTTVFMMLAFITITAAKYTETKKTSQSAFGLGGERKVSIFFNANVWKQGKDSGGNIVEASYYLYVWHNDGDTNSLQETLIPSAHITPTIGGTQMDLLVFEYDASTLNRMIFLRWDPTVAPSTNLEYGNGLWNKTIDITYSSSINYYCIDGWGNDNPAVATPNTNRIVKNGNTLSWGS